MRALELRDPTCPDCGSELLEVIAGEQLALFWMYGHGAIERSTYRTCKACTYVLTIEQTIVRPDRTS